MRYDITDDFRQAVITWLETEELTYREAAKIAKCSHGAIANIVNGVSKQINSPLKIALENRVNKHRDPKELQNEIKNGIKGIKRNQIELCQFDVSVIHNIQKYKEDNLLSYDAMKDKFNVPVVKLAEWMEADYSNQETFTMTYEDFPIFAAFVSQVLGEQTKG